MKRTAWNPVRTNGPELLKPRSPQAMLPATVLTLEVTNGNLRLSSSLAFEGTLMSPISNLKRGADTSMISLLEEMPDNKVSSRYSITLNIR